MEPIERLCEVAVYAHPGLPHMRVRVDPEPGYPGCVRVFLSEDTWDTLHKDKAAILQFYRSVREFPYGVQPLFGPDYQRALRRYFGELPSQAWYDQLLLSD